jgi:hypothetical protein
MPLTQLSGIRALLRCCPTTGVCRWAGSQPPLSHSSGLSVHSPVVDDGITRVEGAGQGVSSRGGVSLGGMTSAMSAIWLTSS